MVLAWYVYPFSFTYQKKIILTIGFILIAGHNLLDEYVMEGQSFQSVIWYLLHQQKTLIISSNSMVFLHYPVIPWIGVMAIGYCFGEFYKRDFNARIRKKWLLRLGFGAIILFFVIRGINIYGDLVPWTIQNSTAKTILSFFKVTKYPPSLAYILVTIGPALLFLFSVETIKNKFTDFFLVFGRVPLFYYFLHVLVIHIVAIIGILIFGGNWRDMILTADVFAYAKLINYGYSLFIVYVVWIGIIILLYFPCKKYMIYKATHKDKWWLSYL